MSVYGRVGVLCKVTRARCGGSPISQSDGRVDTAGAEQLLQVWAAEAVMRE